MHYSGILTILAFTTWTLAYRQPYSNIARDIHSYGNLKARDAYTSHLYARDAYAYAVADPYADAEHDGYGYGHLYARYADADPEAEYDGYGYGHLYARYAEPVLTAEETKQKALEVVHKVADQKAAADKKTYKIPTQLRQDAHDKLNAPFPAQGTAQEQENHRLSRMRAVQQLAAANAMLPQGGPASHNNDWVRLDAQLNKVGIGQV